MLELTFELIVPSLIAVIINHKPPSHFNKFSSNDVLYDPEIDTHKHQYDNVGKSLWEHNGQEEVTIEHSDY